VEAERSLPSGGALDVLRELFVVRGIPGHIRSDNGPELIAHAIRDYLAAADVGTLYIEPGAPWQNGYAESFHARLRDGLPDAEMFAGLGEAKALAANWKNDNNHRPRGRPHSSLGYRTPAEYAAELRGQPREQLRGSLRLAPLRATPSAPPASADQPSTLMAAGT